MAVPLVAGLVGQHDAVGVAATRARRRVGFRGGVHDPPFAGWPISHAPLGPPIWRALEDGVGADRQQGPVGGAGADADDAAMADGLAALHAAACREQRHERDDEGEENGAHGRIVATEAG